jgi:hypothetical protein
MLRFLFSHEKFQLFDLKAEKYRISCKNLANIFARLVITSSFGLEMAFWELWLISLLELSEET